MGTCRPIRTAAVAAAGTAGRRRRNLRDAAVGGLGTQDGRITRNCFPARALGRGHRLDGQFTAGCHEHRHHPRPAGLAAPSSDPFLVTPETIIPALAWPILRVPCVPLPSASSAIQGPGRPPEGNPPRAEDAGFRSAFAGMDNPGHFHGRGGIHRLDGHASGLRVDALRDGRGDAGRVQDLRRRRPDPRHRTVRLAWCGAGRAGRGNVGGAAADFRRRQLDSLSDHDNSLLRTIAIDGLLRRSQVTSGPCSHRRQLCRPAGPCPR